MRDKKVISLADRLNDSSLCSPEIALTLALDDIGERGAFKNGKKLLILALDEGENGDSYGMSFRQAGMSMSECIALCDISKTLFLTEMDLIPGAINE